RSLFVQEPYSGAWQKNDELTREDVTAHHAVFACVSLISQDIGKMPIQLKKREKDVLVNAEIPSKFRVLKKPNRFQIWQQFSENWTTSLLLRGNTYVLKRRDIFGEVAELVVLNPDMCKPLIDDNGNVFYQLNNDRLAQTESVVVPASEIIHDRINCFYHPLVGLTPIMACSLAAGQGIEIQRNSRNLFRNNSRPSGVLTTPGSITNEKAAELRKQWNANYSGANLGGTAVLGDGVTFQTITVSAADSQLIEQLKMTAEIICSVFHVPLFKVGLGPTPSGKISDLNEIYYSDCLQSPIEARENLLDDGLGLLDSGLEAFLNINVLIRMDSTSQMARLKEGVGAAILTPNEARVEVGLLPIPGGDTVYMQQQNYSVAALAKRDQKEDPFSKESTAKTEPKPTETDSKSLYKGVFKPDNQYKIGQFVTKNGSLWHVEKAHLGEFDHENFKLVQKKWGES
uniref:phage portal protein n=1 Tax=Acinetobacter sp. TaxID=472 RepID=UPI0038907CAA